MNKRWDNFGMNKSVLFIKYAKLFIYEADDYWGPEVMWQTDGLPYVAKLDLWITTWERLGTPGLGNFIPIQAKNSFQRLLDLPLILCLLGCPQLLVIIEASTVSDCWPWWESPVCGPQNEGRGKLSFSPSLPIHPFQQTSGKWIALRFQFKHFRGQKHWRCLHPFHSMYVILSSVHIWSNLFNYITSFNFSCVSHFRPIFQTWN
jgi:hypothetical protein